MHGASGNAPCRQIQSVRLRDSLLASWHGSDRLQDLRSDLVGVALRIGTAVFQIALVSVVHERVRNADRRATIRDAVAELVD